MSSAHHTAGGDQGHRWIDSQDSSGDQVPALQVQESTYLGGGSYGHRIGIVVLNRETERSLGWMIYSLDLNGLSCPLRLISDSFRCFSGLSIERNSSTWYFWR